MGWPVGERCYFNSVGVLQHNTGCQPGVCEPAIRLRHVLTKIDACTFMAHTAMRTDATCNCAPDRAGLDQAFLWRFLLFASFTPG
jgi:hypothetical protein